MGVHGYIFLLEVFFMKHSACNWNVTVGYSTSQMMTVSKSTSVICQQQHFAKQS